jgi:hypothetical protein
MPDEFVTAVSPVTDPPPEATANVTLTPETGFPFESVTFTAGGTVTGLPAAAVCPFETGFAIAMLAAGPATPVALIVTSPDTPGVDAVIELPPAVVPSVQEPTVATPEEFVVATAPVIDPPPLATEKFTVAPFTGLLFPSTTFTEGAVVTAEPATAV